MSARDLTRRAAATGRAALSLVGLLMLLVFPFQRVHSSLSHFRAHEARRTIVRHTLLARTPEGATADESYKYPIEFAGQLEDTDQSEPATENCTLLTNPVKFYLTRLKLGPSQAGSQDPLFH
jgi:hypothetical protein